MITSREADFTPKQEGNSDGMLSKASSSSNLWSKLKDPRIVRVSRTFGGKDRHSKVCTVRGLRDRRVRLSVPTAIQLYDLQDRLGLNQPSKVVDWLLNAAKPEIDQLPPLQIPPGTFGQTLIQPMLTNYSHGVGTSQSDKDVIKMNSGINWENPLELSSSNYWNSDANLRGIKSKEVARETVDDNEEGKQGDHHLEGHGEFVSSNNFFSRPNHSFLPNNAMQPNSLLRWDPSNLSLSHLGSHGFTPQTEENLHNLNVVSLSPNFSFPSGPQFLVYPPAGTTQSYFPSHVASAGEFDPKPINFQVMSSSTSQNNPLSNSPLTAPPVYTMRPFHLSMSTTPNLFPSQNDSGSEPNKDD